MSKHINFIRSNVNPILEPNPEFLWEASATFNPSILEENDNYWLTYRALSAEQIYEGQAMKVSSIGLAESDDGLHFDPSTHRQLVSPGCDFDRFGCEDPRITKIDDQYLIFYTAISSWPPNADSIKVAVAMSDDLKTIKEKHLVTPFNAKAFALFPEKINDQYVAVLTVNTDQPPAKIAIAKFDHLEQLWDQNYWENWYEHLNDHVLELPRYNTDHVEVGAVPVKTEAGWILIYSHIQNYFDPGKRIFGIEAALLDLNDPQKIVGRSERYLLKPRVDYELKGMVENVIFPSGAMIAGNEFRIYYGATDTVGAVASTDLGLFLSLLKNSKTKNVVKFHKFKSNPIISPNENKHWQAQAVFNSAAVYANEQFYLFYRAMSWDNTSTIGGAISDDGFHFRDLAQDPIYVPRMKFESKSKTNAFSGCEDPRITKINDRFYMFYTAYNGESPPQVALSSIKEADFKNHNWLWSEPILISDPQIDNKNACLFPEKINGRYVILHRVSGRDITIDLIDDLNELGNGWLEKEAAISPNFNSWDSIKIGIAGPPIKTEKGWLLIYHGVSRFDKNYRLGYMILDLDDPFNVLYRSEFPILEPEYDFEKKGIVDNVVFSCGSVEKDGIIYLYYGGADRVMAVATYELNKLLAVI